MSANYSEEGLLCTINGVRLGHNQKAGYIIVSPGAQGEVTRPAGADELAPIGVAASLQSSSDINRFEDALGQGDRPGHLLIPAEYNIRCQLTIIHEHPLGWNHETGEWRAYGGESTANASAAAAALGGAGGNGIIFPYGIELNKGLEDEPGGDSPAANPSDPEAIASGAAPPCEGEQDVDGDGFLDAGCEPSASGREAEAFLGDVGGDGILDSFQLSEPSAFGP